MSWGILGRTFHMSSQQQDGERKYATSQMGISRTTRGIIIPRPAPMIRLDTDVDGFDNAMITKE